MSRKVKNIIMITIIIIVCIASGFTINIAKESGEGTNQGNPPQMSNSSGENNSNGQMGTPPSGNGMGVNTQMPNNSNGNNQGTPPSKPDESNGNSSTEPPTKPDDSNGSNSTGSLAKPNDSNGNNSIGSQQNQMMGKPDVQNNSNSQENENMSDMQNGENNTKIETSYYIIFVIEAFVVSILVIYLIMSGFNSKTLVETLNGAKNIIIYIILVAIVTTGLIFTQSYITKNISSSNTQNQIQNNMQMPGGQGETASNITYTANKEISEDSTIENGEYSSTTSNENAIIATGDVDVNLSNITVDKTGDSDGGDSSNFYGNNSAILAKNGVNLTIKNATITTEADGANGVFSYGGSATTNNSSSDGTTITITDSTITTTGDNAGGIMTTGGGTTNASNLTINTSGTSSAAIRSDRGGGTVNVNGGTYTTTGNGSPSIYSTADITVNDATLVAKASEGIVIEGANTVTINNCDLTDSNTKLNGQSTTYKNIFLYQSMSGDASNGNATSTAKKSKITTNNGDTFYITNTTATINLTNNTIVNNDSTGNFLRAQKDSWGNTGSNGGNVTLIMTQQNAGGNIVIDSISTLDMAMSENSYYEGTINESNEAKSITLKLDSTSKIKLTGDSYVTSLEDDDTTYSNIDFNGYKLYVNGVAIN